MPRVNGSYKSLGFKDGVEWLELVAFERELQGDSAIGAESAMRAWANRNGIEVRRFGRVPCCNGARGDDYCVQHKALPPKLWMQGPRIDPTKLTNGPRP